MVDGGSEAGFAKLGSADLVEREGASFEELEDDGALEHGVLREEHDSGTTGSNSADKFVMADDAALHHFIIA